MPTVFAIPTVWKTFSNFNIKQLIAYLALFSIIPNFKTDYLKNKQQFPINW